MAAQFQVNIQISAGTDFYQEFNLTNADFSPLNLTDYKIYAALRKHANEKNVVQESTVSTDTVTTHFETNIEDVLGGVYSIFMPFEKTDDLEEGKYVYSVVLQEPNGHWEEVTSGLAFVDRSFGLILNQETED